jgi:hypothetical protein
MMRRSVAIRHPETYARLRVTYTADYTPPEPAVGWVGGWNVYDVLEAYDADAGEALPAAELETLAAVVEDALNT